MRDVLNHWHDSYQMVIEGLRIRQSHIQEMLRQIETGNGKLCPCCLYQITKIEMSEMQ